MNTTHCLGLVGGLGVGATIHYYERLARAHAAQGRKLDIVIVNADTSQVFEFIQANNRDGLAEYLTSYIRRLKAAGAEVAAIPAVAPHFCVRKLIAISPLPILNIFDPLVQELAVRKAQRVAIFGTRFVMESALFGEVTGVEIMKLQQEEVDYIHNTYVALAQILQGSQEQHEKLTALAHTVLKRGRLDAIILAGTDFTVLFNEANLEFPCVDCAALHLKAILHKLVS
jgi:aspartate racemase